MSLSSTLRALPVLIYPKNYHKMMVSKIIRSTIVALVAILCTVSLARSSAAVSGKDMVRVAVLKDAKEFDLSIRGRYQIIDLSTNKELYRGKRLKRSSVTAARGKTVIGRQEYLVRRLRIIAQKDVAIYIKGKKRRYRDQIDIIRGEKNTFLVINRLDLESYVKGVLYHEVPHRWPLNAIKAQAVATRTYALYRISQNETQEYDVTSDIYSQVYGGRSAERHRSNIAANRTRGEILTYKDKILPAELEISLPTIHNVLLCIPAMVFWPATVLWSVMMT